MHEFTSSGSAQSRQKIKYYYRVILVFKKHHNKWFLTEDRILWSKACEKTNLKKFRAEIQMVEDRVLSGFQSMTISAKIAINMIEKMSLVIDGTKIYDVLSQNFKY